MDETPVTVTQLKAPRLSRQIFGGILDYDGAGHYPGIELLNFVYCNRDGTPLHTKDNTYLERRAQDFARRLVWDDDFEAHPKRKEVLFDRATEDAVRKLLECLQLAIPSSAKRPSWERAHFFPYSLSLIHWDARKRGGQPEPRIERRYLRGGGALLYRILRTDPDRGRRQRCSEGFELLYRADNESSLERLMSVLSSHGHKDRSFVLDTVEPQSKLFNDDLENLYRDGTARILGHTKLPTVARVRALLNWSGFWLVTAQNSRAASFAEKNVSPIICDCGASHAQLRRASQRCLKSLQGQILDAVEIAVDQADGELSKKARDKIRGFFWATAATVGLLNAWRGRRHFTLGLDLLEALVLASTEADSEMTFESFVSDWLYQRCNIIVGRSAAEQADLLNVFDASIFEDNENQLAQQMSTAGLLTEYSDATRMVGTGGLR